MPFRLIAYEAVDGRVPFREWLYSIRDPTTRNRIEAKLARVELGNLGDHRELGGGLAELRLAFGPGYRIYFARSGREIVLLYCGGHKGTQHRDISAAKELHREYQKRIAKPGHTLE